MPAYYVELRIPTCIGDDGHSCVKDATCEVRDGLNQIIGTRCREHAAKLVRQLNEGEPPCRTATSGAVTGTSREPAWVTRLMGERDLPR